MIGSDRIKEILEDLGYKLSDKGSYWQSNAVYRGGDNSTALQIYKDTGAWKDYVQNTPFMPFKKLLILTLNTNDPQKLSQYLNKEETFFLTEKSRNKIDKLESEEIYPTSVLDKLLPHYKFYNDRGISDEILIKLKGGLATRSQMYQRFVFPIYNEYGQIHGFSGRDLSGKEGKPKWKHMGKKTRWVYPAFVPYGNGFLIDSMDKSYIILVESIGDALNCMQHGINNVLVSFGLDISSKLICSLIQYDFKKVIISFNNDSDKNYNRGMDACIKSYLKLLSCYDSNNIQICLPIKNDFGDMNESDFRAWKDKLKKLDGFNQAPKIIKIGNKMKASKKLSKKLCKNLQLLNEQT